MKVVSPKDCGNSPKKLLIHDQIIAAAKKDIHTLETTFADDITWTITGKNTIRGKKEVLETFNIHFNQDITEVEIHNIITHGSTAAANGSYKTVNSDYSFCHVYSFVSAGKNVIKEITSYLIRI